MENDCVMLENMYGLIEDTTDDYDTDLAGLESIFYEDDDDIALESVRSGIKAGLESLILKIKDVSRKCGYFIEKKKATLEKAYKKMLKRKEKAEFHNPKKLAKILHGKFNYKDLINCENMIQKINNDALKIISAILSKDPSEFANEENFNKFFDNINKLNLSLEQVIMRLPNVNVISIGNDGDLKKFNFSYGNKYISEPATKWIKDIDNVISHGFRTAEKISNELSESQLKIVSQMKDLDDKASQAVKDSTKDTKKQAKFARKAVLIIRKECFFILLLLSHMLTYYKSIVTSITSGYALACNMAY